MSTLFHVSASSEAQANTSNFYRKPFICKYSFVRRPFPKAQQSARIIIQRLRCNLCVEDGVVERFRRVDNDRRKSKSRTKHTKLLSFSSGIRSFTAQAHCLFFFSSYWLGEGLRESNTTAIVYTGSSPFLSSVCLSNVCIPHVSEKYFTAEF